MGRGLLLPEVCIQADDRWIPVFDDMAFIVVTRLNDVEIRVNLDAGYWEVAKVYQASEVRSVLLVRNLETGIITVHGQAAAEGKGSILGTNTGIGRVT